MNYKDIVLGRLHHVVNGRYLFSIISIVPIVIYFVTICRYSLNYPYADDYEAILQFLIRYEHSRGFWPTVKLLFSQHNEHRILLSHIAYVIYYKLIGVINFRHLIFFANLQLIVLVAIFLYFLRQFLRHYWSAMLFITILVMFDLNSYENANWAMSGMHNYGVAMFFFLALFFYNQNGVRFLILGAACHCLAVLSSGLVGGLVLILFNLANRSKVKSVVSLFITIGCVLLYFIGYSSPKVGHGASVVNIVQFFLHTLGANFGYKIGMVGAVALIIGIATFFPIKRNFKIETNALPLIAILVFAVVTMGGIAFLRAGISMEVSYSTRYFIYPHLVLCIACAFMINGFQNKKWLKLSVLGTLIILLSIYGVSYQYGTAGFARIRQCIQDFGCYTDESIIINKSILDQACKQGIFCTDGKLPLDP